MDAVKYLKEMNRMCNGANCCECPLYANNNGKKVNCEILEKEYAEEAVSIVEKWSAEHPVKTRKSEFLKMFPNVKLLNNEIIDICPRCVDITLPERPRCYSVKCPECKKDYWLAEIK